MGCCGKTIQTAKNIASGYTALALGKKYEFTNDRIEECEKCDNSRHLGTILICSICKCPIGAAARAKNKKCPKDKWDK